MLPMQKALMLSSFSSVIGTGGGGGSFTPPTSTKVWIEADATKAYTDAGVTLVTADGDAIYQLNDKTVNANNPQATAAGDRPGWKPGAKPYVLFDGTSDQMSQAAGFAYADGSGQQWLAIAASTSSFAALQYLCALRTSGGQVNPRIEINTSGNLRAACDSGVVNSNNAAVTLNTPFTAIVNLGTGGVELFFNGVTTTIVALGGALSTTNTLLFIGGLFAGFAPMKLYGVMAGSGILSGAEVTSVHGRLSGLY